MTAVRAAGYTSSLTRGEFKEVTNIIYRYFSYFLIWITI